MVRSAQRGVFSHSRLLWRAFVTGKTWSADKDHLGQNDRQLTL